MTGRPDTPKQGNATATLTLLLLTGGFAVPAFAAAPAPDHDIFCDDHHEATPEVSPAELAATPVSHELEVSESSDPEAISADQLMKPRFDAMVREVSVEDENEKGLKEAQIEVDDPAALRIRVPGVSDEELVRFKRQMYRRDI